MNHKYLIGTLYFLITVQFSSYSQISEEEDEGKVFFENQKAEGQNINILVWGGGYSPSGNQVSLESNVKYFHRIKDKMGLGRFKSCTLFADGKAKNRDIQFRDPNFSVPEPNLIIAEIFGTTRGIYNQYRDNRLNADGPSSINALDNWFRDLNTTHKNSLNLIYFTGHGGKGDKKTPHNTTTHLWNNQKFKVSDLAKKLDSIQPTQSTILIMVQCYSGGFANYIFNEGNSEKGLHPQIRAGFFATKHDRVAAGCTPDIREENYQEYSTRFWEALCGESRIGKQIKRPDYDGDGKTSLSEAHAYVLINSNTIDLPIKTTDVFLRKFSSLDPPKDNNSTFLQQSVQNSINHGKKLLNKNDSEISDWIFVNAPISKILTFSSSESNATINAISQRLGLQDENRYEQAKRKIEELKKKRDGLSKTKKQKEDQCKELKNKIKQRLRDEWPELANIHHPKVDSIKSLNNGAKLISLVNHQNQWNNLRKLKNEISEIENEKFILEKNQVLAMRLKFEIENIVLSVALNKIASPEIIKRYKEIEKLEKTTFEF